MTTQINYHFDKIICGIIILVIVLVAGVRIIFYSIKECIKKKEKKPIETITPPNPQYYNPYTEYIKKMNL